MARVGRQGQIHLWLRDYWAKGSVFQDYRETPASENTTESKHQFRALCWRLTTKREIRSNLCLSVRACRVSGSESLQSFGLHVPAIEHADFQKKLLLLEDLGDQLLLGCIQVLLLYFQVYGVKKSTK